MYLYDTNGVGYLLRPDYSHILSSVLHGNQPKVKILVNAKKQATRICTLSFTYLLFELIWFDVFYELSSLKHFLLFFELILFLLIGSITIWDSNLELKKKISSESTQRLSESKSLIYELSIRTICMLSTVILHLCTVWELLAWYKSNAVANYNEKDLLVDNQMVPNNLTWMVLLLLSVFSSVLISNSAYLMFIFINLLKFEIGLYRMESNVEAAEYEPTHEADMKNQESITQKKGCLKSSVKELLNKIRKVFQKIFTKVSVQKEFSTTNFEYSNV